MGVAFFILGSIVSPGYAKFNLNLIDGENAEINDLFKYFNNGISILCKSYKKTAFGGANTDLGIFDCENIQIVNGAQTVGTIGEFYKCPIEGSPNAEVFVKIISLE